MDRRAGRKPSRVQFHRPTVRRPLPVDESAGDWNRWLDDDLIGEVHTCEGMCPDPDLAAVSHFQHAVVRLVRRQIARLQLMQEAGAESSTGELRTVPALVPISHLTPVLAQLLAPLLALMLAGLFSAAGALLGSLATAYGFSPCAAFCPQPRSWLGQLLAIFIPNWSPAADSSLLHPF